MSSSLVKSCTWLEPLLPANVPVELLVKADAMRFLAGRLTEQLPVRTARCVGELLQITSSYYSNLIEGQYTEPLTLAATAPRRSSKQLQELAVAHVRAQGVFERFIRGHGHLPWAASFSPALLSLVHQRLFRDASEAELRLPDGSLMVPGQLRDQAGKNVSVGQHDAPDYSAVIPMLERMQQVYGGVEDPRLRLMAVLSYHHRLAWVHPFPDGNGRVVRLITHLQLYRLGLVSPLWSLSRGLARQQPQYYDRLANADAPRRGDLDGRGQLTQAGLFEFLNFMFDTCLDQMQYMNDALSLAPLRERMERILAYEPRLVEAGIKPEAARALQILISQGCVSRGDFKVYLGLGERVAIEQLKRLIELGLVESPTPKSRELYPGLPVWFAQLLFPELHRRFY